MALEKSNRAKGSWIFHFLVCKAQYTCHKRGWIGENVQPRSRWLRYTKLDTSHSGFRRSHPCARQENPIQRWNWSFVNSNTDSIKYSINSSGTGNSSIPSPSIYPSKDHIQEIRSAPSFKRQPQSLTELSPTLCGVVYRNQKRQTQEASGDNSHHQALNHETSESFLNRSRKSASDWIILKKTLQKTLNQATGNLLQVTRNICAWTTVIHSNAGFPMLMEYE